MNLLFLNSLYAPHISGAAELVLQRTVEGLQRRGHQVCVLTTGPLSGLHRDQVKGVKVYRAGLLNSYWHFSQGRPGALAQLGWHLRDRYNPGMGQLVRQVVELEKVDLVVCHNLGGWSVAAWDSIASLGVPMVQVLHDLYLLCTGANLFKNNERCKGQCTLCKHLRSGHAQRAEQVDGVIAVSRFLLARLHAEGFFRNALSQVIFNSGARVEDTVIRLPHGRLTDGEPLRFGYLGPLSPSKGVAWLIEQFKRLPFKASLNIAGRGQADYERELRTLAADCEHIQFVGQQAPEAFYQHIDVAVVPSIWDEPSGAVAVQACAQSVPVIASSRGALLEIVREGENGLLCDPDDPDSLGLAMLRLAGEPSLRQRLACHARASVLPMLDLERMLDSYQAFFHQVLVKRGVRQRLDFAAHPS